MDAQVTVVAEDVQVAAKPRRRTYTAEYKRRILKEADACTTPGAVGALLRREGLYSSHLVVWRRARGRGELAALAPKKRGRKPTPVDRPRPEDHRARAAAGRDDRAGRAGRGPGGRPKKLGGAARPAGGDRAVMIALVEERRAQVGIAPLCAALGLARATFYRRRGGPPPAAGPAGAAGAPAGLDGGGARGGLGPAARGAVRRSAAGAGLGPGARCRPGAAVFDPHDVPGAGGQRGGPRAPRPAPAPGLPQARAARDRPQPGLELGHHQAPGPGQVDLLLPLRPARYLQPLRRRLAAGPPGERGPGQGAHRRELRAPAHRPATSSSSMPTAARR